MSKQLTEVNKGEVWKPWPKNPKYVVSSLGRVKNLKYGWFINPSKTTDGYMHFNSYLNGKRKTVRVHRVVLETFRGTGAENLEASHINGKRSDNRLVNLTWETRLQNTKRKYQHGTIPNGERGNSKLTEKEVLDIRKQYTSGKVTYKELSNKFKICETAIGQIVRRQRWKHI